MVAFFLDTLLLSPLTDEEDWLFLDDFLSDRRRCSAPEEGSCGSIVPVEGKAIVLDDEGNAPATITEIDRAMNDFVLIMMVWIVRLIN